MDREDEIRLIAYRLWEDSGCCHGLDLEHWIRAEALWEQENKKQPAALTRQTETKRFVKPGKPRKTTRGK